MSNKEINTKFSHDNVFLHDEKFMLFMGNSFYGQLGVAYNRDPKTLKEVRKTFHVWLDELIDIWIERSPQLQREVDEDAKDLEEFRKGALEALNCGDFDLNIDRSKPWLNTIDV